MAGFQQAVGRWAAAAPFAGGQVTTEIGIEFFSGVVQRSPILSGRFRDSNQIGKGAPDLTVEPPRAGFSTTVEGSPPDASRLSQARGLLSGMRWGESVHVTNNLGYARDVEDRNTTSNAVYGNTFTEVTSRLDAIIRRARARARRGGV